MHLLQRFVAGSLFLSMPAWGADGPVGREKVAPPAGYKAMEVLGVVPHDEGNTLVLASSSEARVLPIGIGESEALSIHLRLAKRPFDRPLTHDLLDEVMKRLGSRVVKVQIDRLEEGVFHGRIFFTTDAGVASVDARASDACALAIGNGAPIYVADRVLAEAGLSPADLMPDRTSAPTGPKTLDL